MQREDEESEDTRKIILLEAPPDDFKRPSVLLPNETPEQALGGLYALLGAIVARVARERAAQPKPEEDNNAA